MGYSARYHAVSLIAVFLALAIGILIGAEFGGDALTNTRKNLEQSLTGNLQDERERADELNGKLSRSDEFASRVYPALVRERLAGKRIGVVALGDLPGETSTAIEEALGPTGAHLVGIGVVREPVDLSGLGGVLSKTRFAKVRRSEETLAEFGDTVTWHKSLADLDPFVGVHFSNELIDAMPVRLISRDAGGEWQEKFVAGKLPEPPPDGFFNGSAYLLGNRPVPWLGKSFEMVNNKGFNIFTPQGARVARV